MRRTGAEPFEIDSSGADPYRRDDGTKFGNVSSAIASSSGRIYQGGNLFTPEGAAGICAEKIAFGAMATAGEYEPAKVVALWRPRTGNDVHIVPPCGWCRQFLFELQPKGGADTLVVLGMDEESPVSRLLPRMIGPGQSSRSDLSRPRGSPSSPIDL